MSFDTTGKLFKKYDTESKSEKFQFREFVIEIADGNYPQYIKFQLVQDRCSILDAYNEGDEIKVHFDLRGREWQGKFFSTLNCWRLEGAEGTTTTAPANGSETATKPATKAAKTIAQTPSADSFPTLSDEPLKVADTDDLPF